MARWRRRLALRFSGLHFCRVGGRGTVVHGERGVAYADGGVKAAGVCYQSVIVRVLSPGTFLKMPWKNGGGVTWEVLTLPDGAGLDTFDVRVSTAEVSRSGPFSTFPGVDRTLVVTSGNGVTLRMSDGGSVTLDAESSPFGFTGEDPCDAELVDGAITDFNVMTRRATFRHRVTPMTLDGEETLVCTGAQTLVLLRSGSLTVRERAVQESTQPDTAAVPMNVGDILAVTPDEPAVVVRSECEVDVVLVEIWRRCPAKS